MTSSISVNDSTATSSLTPKVCHVKCYNGTRIIAVESYLKYTFNMYNVNMYHVILSLINQLVLFIVLPRIPKHTSEILVIDYYLFLSIVQTDIY